MAKFADHMEKIESGVAEGLCAGLVGCLTFGLGLCLAMEVIGHTVWLGVVLGLVGAVGMLTAFWNWQRS